MSSSRVSGKQFNWDMTYPGPDNELGTDDDLKLENELHVPVNAVVHIRLTSEDVIHSFFVPQLRLKQDSLPNRFINVWFEATKAGRYEIPCAELCGFGTLRDARVSQCAYAGKLRCLGARKMAVKEENNDAR